MAYCSAGPALAPLSTSSTPRAWPTIPTPFPPPLRHHPGLLFCVPDRGASGIRSLEGGFSHSYQLVSLRWPPVVTVSVLSTWLVVFVLCHVLSAVYCLSPPILSPHYCFSCSTCVSLVTLLVCLPIYSPGVCSPVWSIVLRRVCYV